MPTHPVKKSLKEVTLSLEKFHRAFEDRIKEFRRLGKTEKELAELTKGAMAMKDAAGIYLSWASHYVERLDKTEGLALEESGDEE